VQDLQIIGSAPSSIGAAKQDVVFSNTGSVTAAVHRTGGTAVSGSVRLFGGSPHYIDVSASLDASGSYTFTGVPAGVYSVTAAINHPQGTSVNGSATVTVTVRDSGTSNNLVTRTFNVTVDQVNQAPTISAITNRVIAVSTSTPAIPFTINDADTPAASLTLSASSDNVAVVPVGSIVFGGSGNNRTVTVTPAFGQTGVANVTITVSDGTNSSSTTFQLTVSPKPSAPGNFHIASQ